MPGTQQSARNAAKHARGSAPTRVPAAAPLLLAIALGITGLAAVPTATAPEDDDPAGRSGVLDHRGNGFRLGADGKIATDHWADGWDREPTAEPASTRSGRRGDERARGRPWRGPGRGRATGARQRRGDAAAERNRRAAEEEHRRLPEDLDAERAVVGRGGNGAARTEIADAEGELNGF